ncbi:MAG: alpha/beta hydrolase [Desulfosudis oleivorans]|nr:alpha/beta hydrolase [Desulfosudis oleivorans]
MQKKILLGISMGAMLALRAAAIEKRIHAAAGLGGFFSMKDAALAQIPPMGRFLYRLKFKDMFNRFASLKASHDMGKRWALNNGYWTIGADTPFDLLEKTDPFSLTEVADKITCDVLIMSSDKDHLIPTSEAGRFKQHIKNARSIQVHCSLDDDGAGDALPGRGHSSFSTRFSLHGLKAFSRRSNSIHVSLDTGKRMPVSTQGIIQHDAETTRQGDPPP